MRPTVPTEATVRVPKTISIVFSEKCFSKPYHLLGVQISQAGRETTGGKEKKKEMGKGGRQERNWNPLRSALFLLYLYISLISHSQEIF